MRSLKILVLEDNPFQLMSIHQMLNASGVYQVLTAEKITAAQNSLARRGPVDIAICNVPMEGGDTLELLEYLAVNQLANGVVLLGAGSAPCLDSAACHANTLGLNVLAALQKPASACVLHRLLEQYSLTLSAPLPEWLSTGRVPANR